jgi:hypothetical protein
MVARFIDELHRSSGSTSELNCFRQPRIWSFDHLGDSVKVDRRNAASSTGSNPENCVESRELCMAEAQ